MEKNSSADLTPVSTKDLETELRGRKDRNLGRCSTCGGRWPVYMGCSDSWQQKEHCFGCRRPVGKCNCSR